MNTYQNNTYNKDLDQLYFSQQFCIFVFVAYSAYVSSYKEYQPHTQQQYSMQGKMVHSCRTTATWLEEDFIEKLVGTPILLIYQ